MSKRNQHQTAYSRPKAELVPLAERLNLLTSFSLSGNLDDWELDEEGAIELIDGYE